MKRFKEKPATKHLEDDMVDTAVLKGATKKMLDLSHKQLSVVPPDVLHLRHLKYLYLENNELKDISEICDNLTQIVWLDLRNNRIQSLPANINFLTKLTHLLMEGNQIKHLPLQLGDLENLRALNLRNNPLIFPPAAIIDNGVKDILEYLREYENSKIEENVSEHDIIYCTVEYKHDVTLSDDDKSSNNCRDLTNTMEDNSSNCRVFKSTNEDSSLDRRDLMSSKEDNPSNCRNLASNGNTSFHCRDLSSTIEYISFNFRDLTSTNEFTTAENKLCTEKHASKDEIAPAVQNKNDIAIEKNRTSNQSVKLTNLNEGAQINNELSPRQQAIIGNVTLSTDDNQKSIEYKHGSVDNKMTPVVPFRLKLLEKYSKDNIIVSSQGKLKNISNKTISPIIPDTIQHTSNNIKLKELVKRDTLTPLSKPTRSTKYNFSFPLQKDINKKGRICMRSKSSYRSELNAPKLNEVNNRRHLMRTARTSRQPRPRPFNPDNGERKKGLEQSYDSNEIRRKNERALDSDKFVSNSCRNSTKNSRNVTSYSRDLASATKTSSGLDIQLEQRIKEHVQTIMEWKYKWKDGNDFSINFEKEREYNEEVLKRKLYDKYKLNN